MLTNFQKNYDEKQSGTVYWNHITNPEMNFQVQLIQLVSTHPVLHSSSQFIMYPDDAVRFISDLEILGIVVNGVGIWCSVPYGIPSRECCPEGYGGPSGVGEWFSEYVHIGYSVPQFDSLPKDLDLAKKCNPLVNSYIQFQLPTERGYNDRIRVSPELYVPYIWDWIPKQK
jgi:hypothetical protein